METQNQVQSGLLLDVVVSQGASRDLFAFAGLGRLSWILAFTFSIGFHLYNVKANFKILI